MRTALRVAGPVLAALLIAPADDALAPMVTKDNFQMPEGLDGLRLKVVQAALAEVGTTSSRPGKASGGKRYGPDHLASYIKAAYNWTDAKIPKDFKKKIDAIQTPWNGSGRRHEADNWCGFFVVYSLKQGGARQNIKWLPSIGIKKEFKPTTKDAKRLGYRKDWANMKPGDVALFSKNSHHSLIVEVGPGNKFKTIDGNGEYGEVNIHEREVGKSAQRIVGFYSLDDLK